MTPLAKKKKRRKIPDKYNLRILFAHSVKSVSPSLQKGVAE
jgi:hypothetical protein